MTSAPCPIWKGSRLAAALESLGFLGQTPTSPPCWYSEKAPGPQEHLPRGPDHTTVPGWEN